MARIIGFVFFFGLVSCKISNDVKSQEYSYEFSDGACTTGRKVFSSLDNYCNGLKSESSNDNCARGSRREQFSTSNCSGDFDSGQ